MNATLPNAIPNAITAEDCLEEQIAQHNGAPSFSAELAKQIRSNEEYEIACQSAINWIDNGMPHEARKVLLQAIGAPESVING